MSIYRTASSILRLSLALLFSINAFAGADWSMFNSQACVHWVRPGENIQDIAQQYGIDAQNLMHLNQLNSSVQLQVGQGINLPENHEYCAAPVAENDFQFPAPPVIDHAVDYNYVQSQPEEDNTEDSTAAYSEDIDLEYTCGTEFGLMDSLRPASLKHEDDDNEVISPAASAFGDRPYAYYGSSESLADALQNFSASYYIPLVLAENVGGEVNGKIGPMTPVDFLDHMSNVYGFIWYFDGHTLYVYNANASQQEILNLTYMNAEHLKETLQKVGVWDSRFFWKSQPEEGLVFISGPPRYVELVSQTAALLDEKEGVRQKSKLTVCTFKLKYAWATDQSFDFRGEQISVPGVTSILQNIINGGGVANISKKETEVPSVEPAKRVSRSTKEKKVNEPTENGGNSGRQLNEGAVADTIYINADPRMNAVIVHDLESKMPMYGKLIKSLDKPTAQIEVSVSIIDVSTSKMDALGVDFGNTRSKGVGEFKFEPQFPGGAPTFTTILSTRFNSFQANLRLLAREGDARIVSKPSILTLDNLEAVLDKSSTTYVAVEANQDAQLFPVTSGTVVQVTPRIIKEKEGRKIHLSINIQDGTDDSSTTQAAKVTNSSINTQAIVHESESLLIGGFYKEETESASTKVPVLGDLPVLGTLFRSDTEKKDKLVRMFLITPRIVELKRT